MQLQARLRTQHPAAKLARRRVDVRSSEQRLRAWISRRLEARARHLSELARALNAISPLATLQRGYAILIDLDSGRVVRSPEQTSAGARLSARVAEGEFIVRVERHD
jgi:exodeoxyribonuclease VII large subunit